VTEPPELWSVILLLPGGQWLLRGAAAAPPTYLIKIIDADGEHRHRLQQVALDLLQRIVVYGPTSEIKGKVD